MKTRFIREFAGFWRYNLVQPLTPIRLDFLPNFPLTMKSISQNTARPDFRACEFSGLKSCRRGWLGPVGLVVAARSNRLAGKFWGRRQSTMPGVVGYIHRRLAFRGQGHRNHHCLRSKDVLPKKRHFSRVLPGLGRYNFVPTVNKAIENFRQTRPVNERKEPKNTAKTPGKPSQSPGTGPVASMTSEARQIPCKVCKGRPPFPVRVPAMRKIISGRLTARETKTHFVILIHLCRFPFWQDSHLLAGLTAETKKYFVSK